ncbi:Werner helicase interacting protein 1 [Geranomyces variabilis]|nr:Werner helicase interacting protein 1 [Geranomyces variabilis]
MTCAPWLAVPYALLADDMTAATVECPVCLKSISENRINRHLDSGCLDVDPKSSQGSGGDAKTPQKVQTKLFSTPKPLTVSEPRSEPSSAKRRHELASVGEAKFTSVPSSGEPQSPLKAPKRARTIAENVPLADFARPTSLDDVRGHEKLIGKGTLLRSLIEQKKVPSLVLWGPPGSGKTTLARIIARSQGSYFKELSATTHNVSDVRKAADEARNHRMLTGQRSVIFLDEIHRFTKTQQDFFLPPVEQGHFQLISATTENPSFRVNNALLSRCRVFVLEKLSKDDLIAVLRRAMALKIEKEGSVVVSDKVLSHLAMLCDGDARAAINTLEMALNSLPPLDSSTSDDGPVSISEEAIMEALQKTSLLYDRQGDEHYNIISALHKSMRGSDDNAALYWLGRMIYSGEDPLYVARRLVRFASEDIGLADNTALSLALATYQSCQVIGMPECDAILGHCVTYLSRAPKSVEVYKAMKNVKHTIETSTAWPVPLHIRNAPTKLMKELDYGKGYKYNPDFQGEVHQTYLPEVLQGINFFTHAPTEVDEEEQKS